MDNKPEETKSPEQSKVTSGDSGDKNTVSEKKSSNKTLIIVLAVVGGLVALGVIGSIVTAVILGNMGKTLFETATNSTINTNGGETTIKSNDGSSSVSVSAKLPEGFPSDISLYPGQTIVSSSRVKTGEDTSWGITAETKDDAAKTVAGLKSLYSGWNMESEVETNGAYSNYYTKGDYAISTYVANENGVTTISYSVVKYAPTTTE